MVDYKTLIDSTELQQKVLDYIASDEFSKMVDSTINVKWLLFTEWLLHLC